MRKMLIGRAALVLVPAVWAAAAAADSLAYWTFNSASTTVSTYEPQLSGIPSLSLIGGTSATFAAGSPNDFNNPSSGPSNQGFNTTGYPGQTAANKTAGIQINFNTTNVSLAAVTLDWRTSNTSSRNLQLQYNIDTVATPTAWVDAQMFTTPGGDAWNGAIGYDFSSFAGSLMNKPNFAVRAVSVFNPGAFVQGANNFADNTAYKASNPTSNYAGTGTWRFDLITVSGQYTPPVFVPSDLVWNTASGNWDTVAGNKPWLKNGTAAAFSQASGVGDNVTFNDPASGSVVTIQAGGVFSNSMTVSTNSLLTFTGGAIGGVGGLSKTGTGRLVLASSNSFTGTNSPNSFTGGTLETRATNAYGSGSLAIGDATWQSTTAAQTFSGNVSFMGNVTFQTDTDLTLGNGLSGSGTMTKTGGGKLRLDGVSSNKGALHIAAGGIDLLNIGAMGGNSTSLETAGAIDMAAGTTLEVSGIGSSNQTRSRYSSAIVMANGSSITRNQFTPGLGASTTNGDSVFTAYTISGSPLDPTFYGGGVMSVSGIATLVNLETRTADMSGAGANNSLIFRMPIAVLPGSTLRLNATNTSPSTFAGSFAGNLGNTSVILGGIQPGVNNNQSLTIYGGATVEALGGSDKRIGERNLGNNIIGLGAAGNDAVFKADFRTYMTDVATDGQQTMLVVAGTGLSGLRIEAPMNAVYDADVNNDRTGFFGINPDTSISAIGNVYSILAPNRMAGLGGFSNEPTQTADGVGITRGGTLTIAATDAAGATGLIDNGPNTNTPVQLGVDNTSTSGALVYELDGSANSGALANFGGLVLKKSAAGNVTTRLQTNVTFHGQLGGHGTLTQQGGTLDLNGHNFSVDGATLEAGEIVGAGAFHAGILNKTTLGHATVARFDAGSLFVTDGRLEIAADGTSAATSRVGAQPVFSSAGVLDLNDNDLIIESGDAVTTRNQIAAGNNGGDWAGTGGITSSAARTNPDGLTSIGYARAADALQIAETDTGVFDGQSVTGTDVLVKYTWVGDNDLSGDVDQSADLTAYIIGLNGGGSTWYEGDYNFDGVVDQTADLTLYIIGLNGQTGTLGGSGSLNSGAVVPEPASLGPALVGLGGLGRRRRR